MSEKKLPNRPPWCIEQNCECQAGQWNEPEKGWSGFCIGKAKDPSILKFNYGEAKHDTNQFYSCLYTPLKGWVKFMVDKLDLAAQVWVAEELAEREGWLDELREEVRKLRWRAHRVAGGETGEESC